MGSSLGTAKGSALDPPKNLFEKRFFGISKKLQ